MRTYFMPLPGETDWPALMPVEAIVRAAADPCLCREEAAREILDVDLAWRSPITDVSGYADEARSFVLPLARRVARLRLDDVNWLTEQAPMDENEAETIHRLRSTSISPPYIEVVQMTPHMFRRNELAYHRIGRTMFELTPLPEFWVEECNRMDEIWAPSEFCRQMFVESGVDADRVRIVRGVIDTCVFSPPPAGSTGPERRNAKLRFLSVLSFEKRKGWDVLLEAYLREFSRSDPVELVLRTTIPGKPISAVSERISEFADALGVPASRRPRVTLLPHRPLNKTEMRQLYLSADVFVAPSRGEGYGRPLLEALSCGVPVITTQWGGQCDFVTEENGWPISYRMVMASGTENALAADLHRGRMWAEPDVEHLRQCMRQALTDRALRERKASAARQSVSRYDQELVADEIAARLSEISRMRPAAIAGRGWRRRSPASRRLMITSPHDRCGIRENTVRLLNGGLDRHVRLLSCPDILRGFVPEADVVHFQYHASYVNPHQLASHPPGGRLMATVHDFHRFDEVSHLFDTIILHTERDRRRLGGLRLKPGVSVHVVPLGCCRPAAKRYRRSGRASPVIAFHGFLNPYKQLTELIGAFARFESRQPGSRLIVLGAVNAFYDVGGMTYLEECRQTVQKHGLGDAVEFITDFLPSDTVIRTIHDRADLVVLPYQRVGDTGSSAAVRTVMASAKPVVVSDAPLFRDLGEEVIRFAADNMDALVDTLSVVWASEILQRRLVERALARVEAEAFTRLASRHLDLYRSDASQSAI